MAKEQQDNGEALNGAPTCAGRNGAHTAGPWCWRDDINGSEYDLSPGILTTNLTDGTPWGDEIDQANARLIAAAPDLLAALQAIVNDPYVERLGSLRLRARTAIAKAEGRTDA